MDHCKNQYEFRKVDLSVVEGAWWDAMGATNTTHFPEFIVLPAQWTLRVGELLAGGRRGWRLREVCRGTGGRSFAYYYRGARVCAARELSAIEVVWQGTGAAVRSRMQDLGRCARGYVGVI